MDNFKIKVGDVQKYMKEELHLYASGMGKRFYIALRSAPNVERYIVKTKDSHRGFAKVGDAVRYFNDN